VLSQGDFTITSNEQEHTGVQIHITKRITEIYSSIQERLQSLEYGSQDTNAFTYFAESQANSFVLIQIPKGTVCKQPITIEVDVHQGTISNRIFLIAEERSSAKIVLRVKGADGVYSSNLVTAWTGSHSNIQFVSLQQLPKTAFSYQNYHAIVGNTAQFSWIDAQLGSAYSKANSYLHLTEPGSVCTNTVLYLASQEQRFDIYTESQHVAPHTNSTIITQGAVNNEAKAVSRGLVRIEHKAAESNGYETQNVLHLSDNAEADAIPNLEIHNHDVKCSHGSTIGHVDKEQLFYLMSRGLSEQEALAQIVDGYFAPVLEIVDEHVANILRTHIAEALQ